MGAVSFGEQIHGHSMTRLEKFWCDLTHGGGFIGRDPSGRINWQCVGCGRWSDHPVSPDEEGRAVRISFGEDRDQTLPLACDTPSPTPPLDERNG